MAAAPRSRASLEVDQNGELVERDLPDLSAVGRRQGVAEGRARRRTVSLKVTMRGDVFDGRSFIKSAIAGKRAEAKSKTGTSISTST